MIAEVADATVDEAKAALDAAADAQAEWAATAPRERGEILRRAYELIVERADDLALLMTLEMGKPIAESKAEVLYAADFFHWFAGEAIRIDGRVQAGREGRLPRADDAPAGRPVPVHHAVELPAGDGHPQDRPGDRRRLHSVIKPAKQTPLSMLALAQILEEAGLPGGVLNVVTAKSSGSVMEPLIKDPRPRKLSFTGSTEVGKTLIEQSAEQVLRVSMELGGNAPFLVFDDADLDDGVEGAMVAKMRNIGEACTSANRFHVAEAVADEFAEQLAERMGALKIGRGTEDGRQGRPADRRRPARQGRRARRRRGEQGRRRARRRREGRRRRLLLQADRHRRRRPTTRAC